VNCLPTFSNGAWLAVTGAWQCVEFFSSRHAPPAGTRISRVKVGFTLFLERQQSDHQRLAAVRVATCS
jgi:hypothetical protein